MPYAPLRSNPRGLIIFTTDGYMSAQLSTADREGFSFGDRFDGTTDEYVADASTYIAYSGPYRVDDLAAILTHTMEVSLFPNWTGRPKSTRSSWTVTRSPWARPPRCGRAGARSWRDWCGDARRRPSPDRPLRWSRRQT